MTDAAAKQHRTFKRAMLIAAAVSLALFAWTVFMILRFNATPASVRFGLGTIAKLASVALPGPVLVTFLGFKAWSRGARGLGWVAAAASVVAAGLLALYGTLLLRPLVGAASYDDAAREAEKAAVTLVNAEAAPMAEAKVVRDRVAQRPTDAVEIAALAGRLRRSAEGVRAAGVGIRGLAPAVVAPFVSRGISSLRAEHFATLYLGPVEPRQLEAVYSEEAMRMDVEAAQLDVLATHAGKWSWTSQGEPAFEEAATGAAYRRIGKP